MKLVILILFFLISCSLSRVKSDLKTFDQTISKKREDFSKVPKDIENKEWVKKKLTHMVEIDQYMRKYLSIPHDSKYSDEEKKDFQDQFNKRFKKIDQSNTSELKKLLKVHRWFTISEFGVQADRNAWLLVQHADLDYEFQKSVLKKLESLWKTKETNPMNYAYLYDRVAVSFHDMSKRTLQRYGTQRKCIGSGKWEPFKIEKPKNVDFRRKKVGLPPLSEYVAGFKNICK